MSNGSYKDAFIQLKNTYLQQYDPGREVPALLQLLSDPSQHHDIQRRTVMTRVAGMIAGRRKGKVSLLIAEESMAVLALIAHLLFRQSRPELSIHAISTNHQLQDTPLCHDVLAQLPGNCTIPDLSELMRTALRSKGFLIAVLHERQGAPIRQVIDHFSKGNPGILLVLDYARYPADSHYQTVRELGLRMVELPDGSGELMCL